MAREYLNSFLVWLGGIFLVAGLPILLVGVWLTRGVAAQRRLDTEGRTTQGAVLVKSRSTSSSTSRSTASSTTTYAVTYRFALPTGETRRGTAKVGRGTWDALVERGPVEVRYLPGSPEVSRIPGQVGETLATLLFVGLGGLATILGGVTCGVGVRQARTARRLLREGVLVEATVERVEESNASFGGADHADAARRRLRRHRGARAADRGLHARGRSARAVRPVKMETRHALALVLLALATLACSRREGAADADPRTTARRAVVGGLSFSVPAGFVRKADERSREPLLNIPGETVEQVFASWEGPGAQRLYLYYWSSLPPRDLGPMVAARRWKTTVAGLETEAAETVTFMGLEQRVFVTWLERPGGAGRFLMYAKDVPRETFDGWLATMRF